ncbi:hypothetical protein LTR17_013047 [Elasticomyces elasticus]|nr:hypothetical protein LTR17_013047 [Elasticomyces elasticus]
MAGKSDITVVGYTPDSDAASMELSMRKAADTTTITEATGMYGDAETAQELGYVHRGLKSRHIQFIAIGGSIGTGLFLGIGGAFAKSGCRAWNVESSGPKDGSAKFIGGQGVFPNDQKAVEIRMKICIHLKAFQCVDVLQTMTEHLRKGDQCDKTLSSGHAVAGCTRAEYVICNGGWHVTLAMMNVRRSAVC